MSGHSIGYSGMSSQVADDRHSSISSPWFISASILVVVAVVAGCKDAGVIRTSGKIVVRSKHSPTGVAMPAWVLQPHFGGHGEGATQMHGAGLMLFCDEV